MRAICLQSVEEVATWRGPHDSQDSIPDVRQGAIYGLLVEWCYQQDNIPQAMQLIQQMLDKGLIPQVYLAEGLVSEVCQVIKAGQHCCHDVMN